MARAVIMAGGQGERFWPLTSEKFPKYRLRFGKSMSLLRHTYERLLKIYGKSKISVITTQNHVRHIREELPGLSRSSIWAEPSRRNTAAAIYLSTALIARHAGRNEVVSFFPADHLIERESLFRRTVQNAIQLAQKENLLVTCGIRPFFPATGYGYIKTGKIISGPLSAYRVDSFREKPDLPKAKRYVRSGRYLWNAGIFTWKAGDLMDSMGRHCPAIAKILDLNNLPESYAKLPRISIDYALMEKARNVAVIKSGMDWCDMGNWDMFCEKLSPGRGGNRFVGPVRASGTSGSMIANYTTAPVVIAGLSGVVVVQTSQGTLVTARGRAEEAALFAKSVKR